MVVRFTVAAVVTVLALAGCGSSPRNAAPPAGVLTASFTGSPPALAELHQQANRLLAAGPAQFKSQLARLHGYPVVVNKWASWCGPCQSEFPAFQRAAVAFGRRVAFLGIDGKDHNPAAAAFLHRFPLSYPSYADPQESIAASIQAATYYPQTIYFDRQGRKVYDHAGPYLSARALELDIRRYVLK